ncbi:SGNH/GDSL hydrolase family protein [Leptospira interrogans]|uniref:SGNH/GDSL hydrolase family protein n=1 Tax=Leptospira interrogans TaxID=173 RepID=UPI00046C7B40|nr:SGNH/GDSL hydrolase family protein [Leptospira interrogans]
MKTILLYADSLSWGIIPNTRSRLTFDERWPGVLENELNSKGRSQKVRVLEDCLNGRRTAWDDPYKPGRNGLKGVAQKIEIHSPLDLVILMLGTNDFQSMHQLNSWHSSQGLAALIGEIRNAPIEPGMKIPPILVVVPPAIGSPKGSIAPKFLGAGSKFVGLADVYKIVAQEFGCSYFDSGTVVQSSRVDGVHLDKEDHYTLGIALVDIVMKTLDR